MPIEQPGRIRGLNIGDGEIGSRLISSNIQSDNYQTGVSGWLISRVNGNVEFNEGVFRGDVAISGNLEVSGSDGILVFGGGDITIASGGQLITGPVTLDPSGLTVGTDVVVDSDGLKVIGGLITPSWHFQAQQVTDNFSLSSTFATVHSVMVTPPSWVQVLNVQVSIFAQMTDSSARNVASHAQQHGSVITGSQFEFGVAGTGVLSTNAASQTLHASTSTFPVTYQQVARVNTGSNSSNRFRLAVKAEGFRS